MLRLTQRYDSPALSRKMRVNLVDSFGSCGRPLFKAIRRRKPTPSAYGPRRQQTVQSVQFASFRILQGSWSIWVLGTSRALTDVYIRTNGCAVDRKYACPWFLSAIVPTRGGKACIRESPNNGRPCILRAGI